MASTKRPAPARSQKLPQTRLQQLALKTDQVMAFVGDTADVTDAAVLGRDKAVIIVCHAANTAPANLPRTLAQLGVNGISFQTSVFDGVDAAGFTIDPDDIPNAPSTKLSTVVNVIQNAPAKA